MSGYVNKELADAMEVLRNNCKNNPACKSCCFYNEVRCYLRRNDPETWGDSDGGGAVATI